jgi:hypothetical protein
LPHTIEVNLLDVPTSTEVFLDQLQGGGGDGAVSA